MSDDNLEQLLRQLVRLARVQVHPVAKELMRSEFFRDGEPREGRIAVYVNLDGSSQSEVADASDVSQATVSRWSKEWKRKGLVDEDGIAVFDFFDFFPDVKKEVGDV